MGRLMKKKIYIFILIIILILIFNQKSIGENFENHQEKYVEKVNSLITVSAPNEFKVILKGEEYIFTMNVNNSISLDGTVNLSFTNLKKVEDFLVQIASVNPITSKSKVSQSEYLYIRFAGGQKIVESFQDIEHLFNHLLADMREWQNPSLE